MTGNHKSNKSTFDKGRPRIFFKNNAGSFPEHLGAREIKMKIKC
jgi:hypothetical protein